MAHCACCQRPNKSLGERISWRGTIPIQTELDVHMYVHTYWLLEVVLYLLRSLLCSRTTFFGFAEHTWLSASTPMWRTRLLLHVHTGEKKIWMLVWKFDWLSFSNIKDYLQLVILASAHKNWVIHCCIDKIFLFKVSLFQIIIFLRGKSCPDIKQLLIQLES